MKGAPLSQDESENPLWGNLSELRGTGDIAQCIISEVTRFSDGAQRVSNEAIQ